MMEGSMSSTEHGSSKPQPDSRQVGVPSREKYSTAKRKQVLGNAHRWHNPDNLRRDTEAELRKEAVWWEGDGWDPTRVVDGTHYASFYHPKELSTTVVGVTHLVVGDNTSTACGMDADPRLVEQAPLRGRDVCRECVSMPMVFGSEEYRAAMARAVRNLQRTG